MWNKIKSFFSSANVEETLRQEQEEHFVKHGRYLQVARDGFRVDVFEAPGPEKGKTIHGYQIRKA